ncbi:GGDEF domain-containing protein [Dyella sp.]|uniref:GGDEF domain-containing protein n=1 Tax=Dyella sp. TaxID=1869338 RepID=UPI002ED43077
MPFLLSLLYVICHGVAILLFADQAMVVSFIFLIVAPVLAAGACLLRSVDAGYSVINGWAALAFGLLMWAIGMALNMRQEVFLGNLESTPGDSMLMYVLYGVPLIFVIASPDQELWYVRAIDAVFAAVLGYLYFVHTFSFANAAGVSEAGIGHLREMFDLENLFILVFSLVRYLTSSGGHQRQFFRTLSIFALVYLLVAGYINHVEPADTDFGGLSDLIIDLPFLAVIVLASVRLKPIPGLARSRRTALFVQAGSPLVLPVTLLAVSGFVVRNHFVLGVAGFVIATLGYGLRSMFIQVRAYEDRDRFNALARVDGLTGVSNRRQFDESAQREWRRARRSGDSLALLMIDIDHFKLLNDVYGHPVGDERLRKVAEVIARCAAGAADLVARYGGEEFAVLLPSVSVHAMLDMAEQMRVAVESQQLASPSPSGRVTISIGAGYINHVVNGEPSRLIALADESLYQAKREGRNRVAWSGAAAFVTED